LESGEVEAVRDGHLGFFLNLVEQAEPHLKGPDQTAWLDRLEAEHDNLRAALEWGQTGEARVEAGARLAGALWWFWVVRTHFSEGREWLDAFASRPDPSPPVRARVLNGAGYLARLQGEHERAATLCGEALTIWRKLGDERGTAWALNTLAFVSQAQGNREQAFGRGEESLALWRKVGDPWGIAYTLHQLGLMMAGHGEAERAKPLATESLDLFRALNDKRNMAFSLWLLAAIASDQADRIAARSYYQQALPLLREIKDRRSLAWLLTLLIWDEPDAVTVQAYYEEALRLAREINERWITMHLLASRGHAARQHGDYSTAMALHRESLLLRQEQRDTYATAQSLEEFADLAARQQQWGRVVRLLGAAESVCAVIGAASPVAIAEEYESAGSGARAALGEEAFATVWADGRAMTLQQAIAYALAESDGT
jgi:tetratricopeptide (TPR) repeat protein